MATRFSLAAMCSAVLPSMSRALTSAPWLASQVVVAAACSRRWCARWCSMVPALGIQRGMDIYPGSLQ